MYLIKYFYFRMFKYFLKIDEDIPYFSTFISIASTLYLHILSIFAFVSSFTLIGKILPNPDEYNKLWYLLFYMPLYFLYDRFVIKTGCHDKILDEFKNETPKQKKISIMFTILYFIFSIAFFIGALWLRQKYKGY